MVKTGKVISIDTVFRGGVIQEPKTGKEFVFSFSECQNLNLLKLNSIVTFEQDRDFKSTPVACLVSVA